jgi:hypothetical protein
VNRQNIIVPYNRPPDQNTEMATMFQAGTCIVIQAYLGHKDIRHTVRYTELSPVWFKGLWKD